MKASVLALCLATPVLANEPPPVPEGGINYVISAPCKDNETGEEGMCHGGYAVDGTFYLTFYQGEILMFIRMVGGGEGYENIWVNDQYNSF